jgi:tetratricopeptide (TPR) repeat protein
LLEESRQAYRTSIEKANDAIANLKKESKSYDKDLAAINSSKFDATYSLGASYFNVGVKKNEAANLIDDLKKFEVARVAADKVFDDALPILEQAFILNPDDPQLLVSLKQLYYRKMAKDDSYKAKYDDIIARMK